MADPTKPTPGARPTPSPGVRPPAPKKMKVEATADGYYDNKLRRVGDVFFIAGTLPKPSELRRGDGSMRDPNVPVMFSSKWMKPAAADAPLGITSSNEAIRRQNAETAANRAAGSEGGDGTVSTEDNPLGADE